MQFMPETIYQQLIIPSSCAGFRLDQALSALLPQYSRSKITQWLKNGNITLNDLPALPKLKVYGNEKIELNIILEQTNPWHAEPLKLNVVFEDKTLLVIDKPVGMVVHPAAGNLTGTLVNALLHYHPNLKTLPRAGLIHRLDKDTSGLLVVAKTLSAHTYLTAQLQERFIEREYLALINGVLTGGGTINQPIGRHPRNRQKMAVIASGKPAITHYRIEEKFQDYTLLKVILETGRTHQIRVHMAFIHHPIVGDQLYNRLQLPKNCNESLKTTLRTFKRQALHAKKLGFKHPSNHKELLFESPIPEDFATLIQIIRKENVS